ncbi:MULTISPECIES: flagellar filament capping protein FliD [unclassified Pseudoalteromonas]|uniref:flagellar filament capping protein FliD n=1 Tax=unclassified Pseudoalteromonas TaxID=194690 RepID=UPI001602096B|nr:MULTISPECIES: flagellar filament capping protein FliD [unclassified Pseudoalteromonas]MBB1295894.1 flagellar filament capping protein FliD [Pseudoalteromonas sp. SR41-7]MBB1351079.1 flagellar filament capping protein FliD [Pseudoalteromonas sp. SG45-3]MBB1359643.1 flagellar filament capping protein FliD [Pseudoalteromonas sp. SG45-6]MBB1443129.1 flagellar filament capping protein FliD [Pseudoalteromonas sp. SG43-3]MBB1450876.1 flagellar filament capping protein FliD [Pseudoalteromonas sp. S
MAISFTGLGSGLAVSDIVDALVNAEQAPAESRLNTTEGKLTTDISAVGALKSALEKVQTSMEALGDSDKYQQRSTSGTDDFISISADEDAQPGGYDVKVNNLATEHKILSQAFDADTAVGEGTMTLTSGDNSFEIEVSDTATLSEIRDAINDSNDNDSINATIITDDSGQHLVMSAKNSGAENEIKIEIADTDGNNTDVNGLSRLAFDTAGVQNASEVIAAIDASITIDGSLTVSSSSNEFAGVIDGITITAKKPHDIDDDISDISITENNNNIRAGLNSFIESYNELLELSNNLGASSEAGAGVMAGDSLLRGVMSKLRSEITESVDLGDGNSLSLSRLGVETDRYGVLTLNTETLDEQIDADVNLVQQFFVGNDDDGFAQSFDELMSFYTDSDGIIQNRIDSKTNQLDDLDDQRLDLASKMESLSSRLYAQYNAMDLLVASLNNTSSYVQAQLENMPGVVRDNS